MRCGRQVIVLGAILFGGFAMLSCGKDSTGPGPTVELFSCNSNSLAGWFLTRGFYVDAYPGVNLSQVDLYVTADASGSYDVSLTIRLDSFDGTLVGGDTTSVTATGTVTDFAKATFTFPQLKIQKNTRVTFDAQQLSGAGTAFLQGSDTTGCVVRGTNDKTPPLSTLQIASESARHISVLGSKN